MHLLRDIDIWQYKLCPQLRSIINIPLMKLEAISSAARLLSGVDTVPRGGESAEIKFPGSEYLHAAQALGVNDTWRCINIF